MIQTASPHESNHALSTEYRMARRFLRKCRPARLRSVREFAEQEIIIPTGKFRRLPFRCNTQPFAGLLFDAIDSGNWNRFAVTGCVQSGKTLLILIVLLYHLFEIVEDVIFAVPKKKLAHFKWKKDIKPVIDQTRFKNLIPSIGAGSRGGQFETITFTNGATLIFMSGSGADEERSSITSRVVVGTEVDKMDEAGEVSQESDPITQLEARTQSYGNDRRIYLECTVSDVVGRIWTEYENGTASQILLPCPHCPTPNHVRLEREHLVGWEEARDKLEAAELAVFACPECGTVWSEQERILANQNALLVHSGQMIERDDDGLLRVVGDVKRTDTLGFRWSGAHNLFWSPGHLGQGEWEALRAGDPDSAERGRKQFFWAIPDELSSIEVTPLKSYAVAERTEGYPRGLVPHNTQWLVAGLDVGKWLLHWVITAITKDGTPHVVDYGRIDVPSNELGIELATMKALLEFGDLIETGFTEQGSGGSRIPDQVWIDSGYAASQIVVYRFCLEHGDRYNAMKGFGIGQHDSAGYRHPQKVTQDIGAIGDGYFARLQAEHGLFLFHIDANFWKSYTHQRLRAESGTRGAMTLFKAPPKEHLSYAAHLTNESETHEFKEGKGIVTVWKTKSRNNHWLDATYMSLAAGHFCGARLIDEPQPTEEDSQSPAQTLMTTPDGRPFFVTQR